jgi:hypothetical protein
MSRDEHEALNATCREVNALADHEARTGRHLSGGTVPDRWILEHPRVYAQLVELARRHPPEEG